MIVQPSCVHVAVNAVSELAPVRESRKVPTEVCAMAIAPVEASAEPAPTGTVTARPLTLADTDGNDCVFPDGPLGLPPHPAATPIASTPAALLQHAQNSRRVGVESSFSLITCHLIRSKNGAQLTLQQEA